MLANLKVRQLDAGPRQARPPEAHQPDACKSQARQPRDVSMTRAMRQRLALAATVIALAHVAATALAQQPVGNVAALEGESQVLHPAGDTWDIVTPGDVIVLGDRFRTMANSKLKLLFQDDSVLTVASDSEISVDENVAPETGETKSRFSLLVGIVQSLVSDRYGTPGASFEVETPTAVAGVRGTRFIAVHDAQAEQTTVVGLSNLTVVRSKADGAGTRAVVLHAGESTSVSRGGMPLQPRRMPDEALKSLTAATRVASIGGGKGTAATRERAKMPGEASTGKRDNVDQPVEQLRDIQRGTGRPPPPPPPVR